MNPSETAPLAAEAVSPEVEIMGAACERGTCPPSHRAARLVSTVIILVLCMALLGAGLYLWWSQRQ